MEESNELCESRGGRPGLPVPNSPYGLCGRETTFNERTHGPSEGIKRLRQNRFCLQRVEKFKINASAEDPKT